MQRFIMKIANIKNTNFKGYIPVRFYAKDPETNKVMAIASKEYIKKCQSFVVRNLNGTAKNAKSDEFVNYYSQIDEDYRKFPHVRSIYERNNPVVYMVTGEDINIVNKMAMPIGKAKGQSLDAFGHTHSFEVNMEARVFFTNAKAFLKNNCSRLKDSSDNKNLILNVLFKPKFNKKKEVKGFEFIEAKFTKEA